MPLENRKRTISCRRPKAESLMMLTFCRSKSRVEFCPLFVPFCAQIGPILDVSERTETKSEARPNSLERLGSLGNWRRGPGSNRRIKVLQTSPLPLGYRAFGRAVFIFSAPHRRSQPGWRRRAIWSGRRDLNSRPSPWQGDALPLSYSRLLQS